MKNRSKKTQKRQQNSDFLIYGHHAAVAAIQNLKRRKIELSPLKAKKHWF